MSGGQWLLRVKCERRVGRTGGSWQVAFLKQKGGVRRRVQVQGSCLSLTICLRFLWSGFPWKEPRRRKESVSMGPDDTEKPRGGPPCGPPAGASHALPPRGAAPRGFGRDEPHCFYCCFLPVAVYPQP